MVEVDVMLRCPPITMLAKSTEPASMVRAPVVVMASSPEILPRYQLPAAETAAAVERVRLPTSTALVPMFASVMVPVPDVSERSFAPVIAPSVMASLLVVMERFPPRTKAPVDTALSICHVPEAVLVPVVVMERAASLVSVSPRDASVTLPDPVLMVRVCAPLTWPSDTALLLVVSV